MEPGTFFEVTRYTYDGYGRSDDDAYSFHTTLEGAKKTIEEIAKTDEDNLMVSIDDGGLPYCFERTTQYGYTKYYIQKQEMED